jgi:hypothetical protein
MISKIIHNFSLGLAALMVSPAAWADYKWVSLNEEQLATIEQQCSQDLSSALQGAGKFVSGSISFAGAASLSIFVVDIGPGPAVMLTEGGKILKNFFSPPELYSLILEQQSGSPGLITQKANVLANEFGISSDVVIASANLAAKEGTICIGESNLEDLSAVKKARSQYQDEQKKRIKDQIKDQIRDY